jgi:hypothetical protein
MFLNEELKQFQNKDKGNLTDKQLANQQGEALEVYDLISSSTDLSSFNLFYNNRLNQSYNNNKGKIRSYREMATMPEIGDVIDDAVNESTQEDDDGNVFNLEIVNEKFAKNENISKVLNEEFDELFNNRLDINKEIWRFYNAFFIDGVLYYERIINVVHWKDGIKNIKWLPPESMDFIFNYELNKIDAFLQYKKERVKRPMSIEEARKDENIIVLLPEQIGFIPYKQGKTKNDIIGYLESCKIPYNQLKLLETSVIIYRLVRAPERFVFKIDVGNMPRDKALAYVNKIKKQMNRSQTYNASTGQMEGTTSIECLRQNTEIKLLDGRSVQLIDLIKEFKNGKENWVYSINQETKKIEPNKIIGADITRKNEKLIRIHLDDGTYHDTTYDHKWILRNGEEVMAENLKINDALMPLKETVQNWPAIINHKVTKIEYLEERDDTGCITVENNHNFALCFNGKPTVFVKNSMLDNVYIPQSDNRGSDVTTIGGNSAGFTELDDVKYFAKKLYRALKYPLSRIDNAFENRHAENIFGGNTFADISRDEVKWSKFLQRNQNKFCTEFKDLFLLHLDFKGLKKQYGLNKNDLNIVMNPPSEYKEQMNQKILETRLNNYSSLSNEESFSKSYLMKKFLKMDDEDIKANADGFVEDKKLFPKDEGF